MRPSHLLVPTALCMLLLAGCAAGATPTTGPTPPPPTATAQPTTPPLPTATPSAMPSPTRPPTTTPSAIPPPTATHDPAAALQAALGYVPRFEPGSCPLRVTNAYAHTCGSLVVPADRRDPTGPQVRLPVIVFHSTSDAPAAEPLIYLAGGGGHDQLKFHEYYLQAQGDEILATRDYVMYNQRGSNHSTPELVCWRYGDLLRELATVPLSYQEQNQRHVAYWLDCQETLLGQGIDLSLYNSAVNAADARDLALALGAQQADYYGTSYGTRIGLDLIRDYPEVVRSLILDSTYPPQVDYYREYPANAARALDELFAASAGRYPDLETTFYTLVDQLNAGPQIVSFEGLDLLVDGGALLDAVYVLLFSDRSIPEIPAMIVAAATGDLTPLAPIFYSETQTPDLNLAVFYSAQCAEETPFDSLDAARQAVAGLPPALADYYVESFAAFHFQLCEQWAVPPADPVEALPVTADVPALVLAGQFDPITPPRWGAETAAALPQGRFVEFPGLGHGVMRANACALQVGLQFLADPAGPLDTNCVDALPAPVFR